MKKNLSVSILISSIATLLLVFMWTYAAFSKLFIYERFRFQLLGHKLLADHAWTVAWVVPAAEIIIAILLVIPKTRVKGFYASLVMLGIFTAYIIYMFIFFPKRPCSCGGIISQLSWQQHIVFNLACMLIALAGILWNRDKAREKYLHQEQLSVWP